MFVSEKMMEDTEWNDILRAKGILPPKPEPETEGPDVEDITKDPREDMTVDEIDRLLEDDMDDDRVLASYRYPRPKLSMRDLFLCGHVII